MDWPWAMQGQFVRGPSSRVALLEKLKVEETGREGLPAFTGRDSLLLLFLGAAAFVVLSVWVLGIGLSYFARLFS